MLQCVVSWHQYRLRRRKNAKRYAGSFDCAASAVVGTLCLMPRRCWRRRIADIKGQSTICLRLGLSFRQGRFRCPGCHRSWHIGRWCRAWLWRGRLLDVGYRRQAESLVQTRFWRKHVRFSWDAVSGPIHAKSAAKVVWAVRRRVGPIEILEDMV